MYPDQARHIVWPDLGPNCLQTLSADATTGVKTCNRINGFNLSAIETFQQI